MKILYISCHEVLEYDEVRMFTQMGHEVFSLHGAYQSPDASSKRPGIPDMHFSKYNRAMELGLQCTREKILPELFDLFDVTIFMHMPQWVLSNLSNLVGRNFVYRAIGQNVSQTELMLAPARNLGMKIVRYSPAETRIPGYIGADAIIRFGKEPSEYQGWTGGTGEIINFTQSLKGRGTHCGYHVLDQVSKRLPNFRVYGNGNEDLPYAGGCVSSEDQVKILQDAAAFLSTGTHPASYTLGFMEAWMTGVPMVVAGAGIGQPHASGYAQDSYEVHELVEHCETGLIANTPNEFVDAANLIANNRDVAEALSERGRAEAIRLFGMDTIKQQWTNFLETL